MAHPSTRPASTRRVNPYLLLTLAVFTWSCNWILGRGFATDIPPMMWACLRWILSIAIALPFAWRYLRSDWPLVRRAWKLMLVLGGAGIGVQSALMFLGLHYTTATNGVVLNSSTPIMIILISWLFVGEPIRRIQAAGVVVSLIGVLAIVSGGSLATLAELRFNAGDLIVLGSMLGWAIYTVMLRFVPPGLHFLALMLAIMSCGTLCLLPFGIAELAAGQRMALTLPNLGAVAFAAIFASLLGTVAWNHGVAQVGANVAGLFIYLMPVFGAVLAWLLLDERLYPYHIAGIALILTGIWITSRGGRGAVRLPGGID